MPDEVTLIVKVAITQQLIDDVLGGAEPEADEVRWAVEETLRGELDLCAGDFANVEVRLA